MKSEICYASVFLAAMVVFGLCSSASAAPITIQLDENGNGSINFGSGPNFITGSLLQDPGPGGQSSVLTYVLDAPNLTAGDLLLTDGGQIEDLIRFNPAGAGGNPNYLSSALIYSSGAHGIDSLADTLQGPFADYSNTLTMKETTVGGGDGVQYTPSSGQPGFVSGFAVKYAITSDVVPEPTSLYTSLGGLLLIGGVAWRKTRQAD
jgi:hypothetical protein